MALGELLPTLVFGCQAATVAQAEQAVRAPTQQRARSDFVRNRFVVDVLIWIMFLRLSCDLNRVVPSLSLIGLSMFSIFVIIESQRQ